MSRDAFTKYNEARQRELTPYRGFSIDYSALRDEYMIFKVSGGQRHHIAYAKSRKHAEEIIDQLDDGRKGNPMAKKAPTAAQKAARAEFARIMKSGGFAKRRKKNPARATRRTGGPITKARPLARSRQSATRPLGRSRQSALDPTLSPAASYADGHDHGGVSNNPIRRRRKVAAKRTPPIMARKTNPTREPCRFAVHVATADGRAGRLLFSAVKKPDAVALAQAWATAKKQRVVIVGKAR